MLKRRLKPFVLPSLYVLLVVLFALFTILMTKSLQVAEDIYEENLTYVSYEVLIDYAIPVINVDNNTIIRPYKDETVTIGKSFYDYTSEESSQENSIIYYENTYIQNFGVDYKKDTEFNVIAILDGTVISVTEDDIVGKTIKVKHNNNLISIYQSLSQTMVKKDDVIKQGEIIGISGTNSMNSKLGNHLHFELIVANKYVNPELYYDKAVGEF